MDGLLAPAGIPSSPAARPRYRRRNRTVLIVVGASVGVTLLVVLLIVSLKRRGGGEATAGPSPTADPAVPGPSSAAAPSPPVAEAVLARLEDAGVVDNHVPYGILAKVGGEKSYRKLLDMQKRYATNQKVRLGR